MSVLKLTGKYFKCFEDSELGFKWVQTSSPMTIEMAQLEGPN